MSELLNRGGVGTKTRKICAKTAKKPLKNASKMHQKRIKNDIKKFRSRTAEFLLLKREQIQEIIFSAPRAERPEGMSTPMRQLKHRTQERIKEIFRSEENK